MNEFYREPLTTDSEVGRIELPEEETSEQEEVLESEIKADLAAKYLQIYDQLEAVNLDKTKSLDAIRCTLDMDERSILAKEYGEYLEQSRKLFGMIGNTKDEMEKEGWIFSRDEQSAFQVGLETNKEGKKLFRISDQFGQTPVKAGDAYLAYLSSANSIPEVVRNRILESFTYTGEKAKELYVAIPETN